jgi:hypothetical protein
LKTIGTSKTSTAEGRPATAKVPATVETSTTLLVLAGTPTTIEVQEKEILEKFSRTAKSS